MIGKKSNAGRVLGSLSARKNTCIHELMETLVMPRGSISGGLSQLHRKGLIRTSASKYGCGFSKRRHTHYVLMSPNNTRIKNGYLASERKETLENYKKVYTNTEFELELLRNENRFLKEKIKEMLGD